VRSGLLAAVAAAVLLPVSAPSTSAAHPSEALPAPRGGSAHSRLVFAAAEEDSTLHGFTTGKVPDPRTYWTVRRDFSQYTPAVWDLLSRRRALLTVNIRWRRDFGAVPKGMPRFGELLPFLRTAARHHVGVIAWLTIPYADGYWLTEDNIAKYQHAVRDFDSWARRVDFRPERVLLDLESPLPDTAKSSNVIRNPLPVIAMLDHNVGPAHQCAAMHGVTRIAGWLERHGYPTIAAAYAFLFDDISDGNVALSDGLDMPLPQPGTFREVSFMSLRSVYAGMVGMDPGLSLNASYIDAMKRWYGKSATFTLGEAGIGPYAGHLDRLVTDTRLAAALTTGTVGIYSLEKALRAYGVAGVAKLFDAVEHPLAGAALAHARAISPETREVRGFIGVENALVTAGLPLAMTGRGTPALPNTWPPHC
jgi:hypothetical protein